MAKKRRLRIDILTLFPGMFRGVFDQSIIAKARSKGLVSISLSDIRAFTTDKHRTVDDRPFGGGAGMVLKAGPIVRAIEHHRSKRDHTTVILLTPQGKVFNQQVARRLSRKKHLVFICGHYEGFDERVRRFVDHEISVGDVVLTGGEIPAMMLVDSIVRLIPGVVKERSSIENDSFFQGRLDHPQYTRPSVFRRMRVPRTLLSGNHKDIEQWRKKMSLQNTAVKRPDLFKLKKIDPEEKKILKTGMI